MATHPQLQQLSSDLNNPELPRDLDAYEKIKCPLTIGAVVSWYYKDEEKFCLEEKIDVRRNSQWEGVLIPRPDIECRGEGLEPEDCVLVVYNEPCEKCYPDVEYVALNRFLDCEDLVELFAVGARS